MTVRIICGFPAVGKTTFQEMFPIQVHDLDSSRYPKTPVGFSEYLDAIEELADGGVIVLVSTHPEVLRGLQDRGLDHLLVFPETACKQEYLDRYRARLSSETFVKQVADNWELWVEGLYDYPRASPIVLGPGMFLSDVVTVEGNRVKLKD